MTNDDQNDAFDCVRDRLQITAKWRRTLLTKYPDDQKLMPAIERLEALAAAPFQDVKPATWSRLNYADSTFSLAVNDVVRAIGFRSRPKNIDHVVMAVAERLGGQEWGGK